MIDQRWLPARLDYLHCKSAAEVAEAIRSMAIRGAPALGVAGAFGIALDALRGEFQTIGEMNERLQRSADKLIRSRPTAVNLAWGVKRIMEVVGN